MSDREYIEQQALAFLDYLTKRGSQSFEIWAASKDFMEDDKEAIRILLMSLLEFDVEICSSMNNRH